MSSRLFDKGRDGFLEKALGWTADTQKAMLLDMSVTGTYTKSITGATNANPVVYTCTQTFSNGDIVVVVGVKGNLSANQIGRVNSVTGTSFQLFTLFPDPDGTNINVGGSGTYTASTGFVINLTQAQFVADILGGRIGTDQTLTSTSSTGGIATSANWTWTAVTGNPAQAIILYDAAGGSDATNRLVGFMDGQISVVIARDVAVSDTTVWIEPAKAAINHTINPTLNFSNGQTLTLTADVTQGARSISVNAASAIITAGNTAETYVSGAGLPVTPNGGNISFTVGTVWSPATSGTTGLFML